ncbi:hypothetical protein [Rubritalea marina]|uniref:hypothetical protein n=1 Tax=Rubritalea marina TaxID=361055 RepID=UPI00036792E7|nr:hypothetical protein [Rubritalea marina]
MSHPRASIILALLSCTVCSSYAGKLLEEQFNDVGILKAEFRVFDHLVDAGWRSSMGETTDGKNNAVITWAVTDRNRLELNSTDTNDTRVSESPAFIWISNPSKDSSNDSLLKLTFDYGSDGGDTIFVNLWAVHSSNETAERTWITNNQGWFNGYSAQTETVSKAGNKVFNLRDGERLIGTKKTSLSEGQKGQGSFQWQVDVSKLGIEGVRNIGDIQSFFLAFSVAEKGGGTVWVDNISLQSASDRSNKSTLLSIGHLDLEMEKSN